MLDLIRVQDLDGITVSDRHNAPCDIGAGCSGGEGAALEVLVGSTAKGLSASTVSRLKQTWAQEYRGWTEERLDKDQWAYI